MGLDWRKFWIDPWKIVCERINHSCQWKRPQSTPLSGMGSNKQVHLNPAVPLGGVQYGLPCCRESQVDTDHLGAWPWLLPLRGAKLGKELGHCLSYSPDPQLSEKRHYLTQNWASWWACLGDKSPPCSPRWLESLTRNIPQLAPSHFHGSRKDQ